jgi:hypothetical protein
MSKTPVTILQTGRCRVCGCTDRRPCQLLEPFRPCGWANVSHTLCDNPRCLAEVPLEVIEREVWP